MTNLNQDEPLDESPTDELPVLTELDVVELGADPIVLAPDDDRFPASDDDDMSFATGRFAPPDDLPEIEPFPEPDEELAFVRRQVQLLEAILDDKDAEIASLAERLRATRDAVERRDETERRLRAELEDAAAQRRRLEARLAEAEALAQQYADRVAELTSQLRTLEQDAARRDKAFAELEAELIAREARVVERERALEEAEAASAGAGAPAGVSGANGAPEDTGVHASPGEPTLEAALARAREEAAALAAYIDCRRAHWLALEAQLDEHRERVRELEQELEQRAERERREAERADAEARRAEALKAELARARANPETGRAAASRESDPTAPDGAAERAEPAEDAPTATLRVPGADDVPTGDAAAPPAVGPAALVCLTSDPPCTYRIGERPLLIGRGPDCDVRIATHFVSREHARIVRERDRILIEDLGSTNGVFVNAVPVDRGPLRDGDLVTIGETQFRFEAEAHSGEAPV
ncbi:MAG TPA: FHA domain-containing protein [Gammaproteobacteria bacterium]